MWILFVCGILQIAKIKVDRQDLERKYRLLLYFRTKFYFLCHFEASKRTVALLEYSNLCANT